MTKGLTIAQKILLVVFLAIIIAGGGMRLYFDSDTYNKKALKNPALVLSRKPQVRLVAVDVDGAVKRPGVYRLAEGAARLDAVQEAGGFRKGASTAAVNLAEIVKDREKIYIPYGGRANAESGVSAAESNASPAETTAMPRGSTDTGSDSRKTGAGSRDDRKKAPRVLNINKASAADFECLPGIGPSFSKRIVELRKLRGPFKTIEEIMLVKGIGAKKFEKIKMYLRVN